MSKEPIAIIGMGCRFPQSPNLYEFWNKLREGIDTIRHLPCDRAAKVRSTERGGFLEKVDRFDADFFRVSDKEAIAIDPQHRLLLEVAWDALEDAGQIPSNLSGMDAGIFVGISSNDYYSIASQHQDVPDIKDLIGNDYGMSANRISYYFDFHGSSMGINASCASSLVAVDYACKSLRNGENSLALACGVNIILSPVVTARFANAGMLSPDGRCKSFDAKANGYVRGEGVGVVVLKLLSQAEADGDRIYAVIRGSAVNHNGRSNGLTAPNMQAQIDLLQKVYQQAGIAPNSVHYIEAHGTATPIGDALEMKALGTVVGKDRDMDNLCRVGCVKTNIGHTEAASGIAGLIKTALSLYYRQIPPNLHFQEPNPSIPFGKLGLKVQESLENLPEEIYPIRAGVSAFGFGGTNAHVILEEYPSQAKSKSITKSSFPLKVLTLTAKTATALQELAIRYQDFLKEQPTVSLDDICFTANTRRSHFKHRLAIVSESKEQLSEQLNAFIQKESLATVVNAQVNRRKPAPIYFICTGKASKIKSVIKSLYHIYVDVYPFLQECDLVLVSHTGKKLLELIDQDGFENNSHYELVNFICEYAIARLWIYWGIEPTSIIGNGIGSYVSATIAKTLTLEEAVSLILKKNTLEDLESSNQSVGTNYIQLDISANQIRYSDKSTTDLNLDLNNTDNTIDDLNETNLQSLLSNLIKFWLMGIKVDWAKVGNYKNCYPISLPTYPFERQSYWISSGLDKDGDRSVNQQELQAGEIQATTTTTDRYITEDMSGEFVAPRDEIEKKVATIWQKILKCNAISIHDNFFELGGTSLLTFQLFAKIVEIFQTNIPLVSLYESPTIEDIANTLKKVKMTQPWYSLFPIKSSGSRPILFGFQNLDVKNFVPYLSEDQPVYFLRYGFASSVDNAVPLPKVEELASHFIQEMQTIQPHGPYFLMGGSFGGVIAYEVACQLIAKGEKIGLLAVFDSYIDIVNNKKSLPLYKWLPRLLLRKLVRLSSKINRIYYIFQLGSTEFLMRIERRLQNIISRNRPNLPDLETAAYYPHGGHGGDMSAHNAIHQVYEPNSYLGKIIFFKATQRWKFLEEDLFPSYEIDPPEIGWKKLVTGELEICKVPGDHSSIYHEPYCRIVGKQLNLSIMRELKNLEKTDL